MPSATDAQVLIFNRTLTGGEFQLLLEIVKAMLFAITGGFLAYYFNARAKEREQGGILFNEFIRERVKTLHNLYRSVAILVNDYLGVLDEQRYKTKSDDLKIISFQNNYLEYQQWDKRKQAIEGFIATLPLKIAALITESETSRYVIGERDHQEFCNNLKKLELQIRDIWDFYASESVTKVLHRFPDLCNEIGQEKAVEQTAGALKGLFNSHARLSRMWVLRALMEIRGSFDSIARFKGTPPAKWLPTLLSRISARYRPQNDNIKEPLVERFQDSMLPSLEQDFLLWRQKRFR